MSGSFAESMRDPQVAHDTRLLGDFAVIYCNGLHSDRERVAVASEGSELGVYGRKTPVLCAECASLLAYAEKRRASCPKDPKPFCSNCDTHCYRPTEREYMREVMKYAGPRSVFRGHAIDSVKHLLEGRKTKKATRETRVASREDNA